MDTNVLFCCILALVIGAQCSSQEKRLVLHSDIDISQEFSNIKALLASQNQSIQTLTGLVSSKDVEIAGLKSDLQNLAQTVSSKDTDIAKLTSDAATQQQEIKQLQAQLLAKDTEIAQLKISDTSTYVRWGKTTCPGNGTTLVYSGYMAGGKHDQGGSGSNYLCLADTPAWDHYDNGHGYGGVRGIEYQFDSHSASEITKFFGSNIFDDDAPCAVCKTTRSSNIMVPGTNVCSKGWTKEYSGYLVSEYPGFSHASQFVCLDRRPDVIPGSKVDDNSARIYINEVDCGSSSLCPPYVQGRELTCVVCSI